MNLSPEQAAYLGDGDRPLFSHEAKHIADTLRSTYGVVAAPATRNDHAVVIVYPERWRIRNLREWSEYVGQAIPLRRPDTMYP
jgi:hypothetical protein